MKIRLKNISPVFSGKKERNQLKGIFHGFGFIILFHLSFLSLRGDNFEAVSNGNWNDWATWTQNGTSATNYPGENSGDIVVIDGNFTINLNVSPAFDISNLDIKNSAVLNLGNNTLKVSTINNQNNSIINVGNGTLTVLSLGVQNTSAITFMSGQLNVIFFNLNGTCDPGTGTINYNRSGDQFLVDIPYYNLIVSGTGIKTLPANASINGNLQIDNNAVLRGNVINLKGNWTDNNSSDGFDETGTTVNMIGTAIQTIYGIPHEDFNELTTSNTTGVTLSSDITVLNLVLHDNCCINKAGFNFPLPDNILEDDPPVANCLGNFTAYLEMDGTVTIDPSDLDDGSTVDCGIPIFSLDNSSFTCANIGSPQTVTLTVKDLYDEQATCTSTVTVSDTIDPIVTTWPSNRTVSLNSDCELEVPDMRSEVVATDNCSGISVTQLPMAGVLLPSGEGFAPTVVITVDDGNGNTVTHNITLTGDDDTDPMVTEWPNDSTISLNSSCELRVPDLTGKVVASDNCSGVTITQNPFFNVLLPSGESTTHTVVMTVDDGRGNTVTHNVILTGNDTISPEFTVPLTDTICRNVDESFLSIVSVTGDVTDEFDNCSGSISATYSDDLSNLTSSDQAGFITRTWKLNDNNGNETLKYQIIWVEPTAKVLATPQKDTICNGEAVSISLSSPTESTRDVRFRYTTEAGYGVTVTPVSGNLLSDGAVLTNTIANSTDTAKLVKFIITPYTRNAGNDNEKCTGINDTAYIWVEPTVLADALPESDTICSGEKAKILLTSPSEPARPVMFNYKTRIPFGVTVNPGSANSLSEGTLLTDVLINHTDTAKRVLFIIEPYTRPAGSETMKCSGIIDTVEVWVEPVPKVSLTPAKDTICTNLHPVIVTSSITRSLRPNKLSYETNYDANFVEVIHVQDTFNLTPGFAIMDTIINHSFIPQLVTFIVHPYLLCTCGSRCEGIADTTYIWVAPELKIMVDSISTYIGGKNVRCFGEANGFIHLKPEGGITAFSGFSDSNLNYSWNNGWRHSRDLNNLTASTYSITMNDQLMCQDDSSFVLEQPEVLSYFIKVVNSLSCAGSDGILSGNIHGGTAGYSYLWTKVPDDYDLVTPPITQDTLFSIIDGTYILAITDTNGCTQAPADTLIQQPPAKAVLALPDPIYGTYQVRCHGENSGQIVTINDNSLPFITYKWEGPGVDTLYANSLKYNYLKNLYAGRYTLTYTDDGGCTGVYVIDMNEPDSLLINQSTVSQYPNGYNVSCFGATDGSIVLNDITGGHDEPYNYDWEVISEGLITNPSARNQSGLPGGTYAVTVTDAQNCMASDTFEITRPDEIKTNAELSASINGGYNLNCYGDTTGFIRLHVSGGVPPDYQYLWEDNGSTSTERYNLSSGDYIVTVKDATGCIITDTIVLNEPALFRIDSTGISDYNGYGITCSGQTNGSVYIRPAGGIADYSYSWTVDGNSMALDTGYITGVGPGNYHLEIRDANNCKINWDGALIGPEPLQISMVSHNMNCTGSVLGSATATVSGGVGQYDFSWSNGASTSSISGLIPDEYILNVTDDNSCLLSDTVTIIQNTEVVLDIQVEQGITCNNFADGILKAVASEGVPPYSFEWDNGPASETITGLKEGNYSVKVTDHEGCTGTESILFSDPEPMLADFAVADAQCYNSIDGSVILNAIGGSGVYIYTWNGLLLGINEVNGLQSGSYNLVVNDSKGCSVDTVVFIGQPDKLRIAPDHQNSVRPFCPDWHNGILAVMVSGGTRDYTYDWGDEYQDEHDSVLMDISEGSFSIHVIDAHHCEADTTLKMQAMNSNCLDVPSAFTPDGNNSNDEWEIRYMTEDGTEVRFNEVYPGGEIQIYDRIGNLVYLCSGGCPQDWDGRDTKGRNLPVDTYYFIIKLSNGDNPLQGIVTIIR